MIYHVEVLEESPKYIQDAIYRALHQGHKDGMGLVSIPSFRCTPSNKAYVDCCLQIGDTFEKVIHNQPHMVDKLCGPEVDKEYRQAEKAGKAYSSEF